MRILHLFSSHWVNVLLKAFPIEFDRLQVCNDIANTMTTVDALIQRIFCVTLEAGRANATSDPPILHLVGLSEVISTLELNPGF